MTKHSPGPFIAEYAPFVNQADCEIPSFRIHDANGDPVAETDSGKPLEIQQADAVLLESAPDLLDALRYCAMTLADLAVSQRKGYITHAQTLARAAITRAKG